MVALRVAALLTLVVLAAAAPPGQGTHTQYSRGYVTGGYTGSGTNWICLGPSSSFDVGASCDLLCPHNPCRVSVSDAVYGSDVTYKICIRNGSCLAGVYHGTAQVSVPAGTRLEVLPSVFGATTGVITTA